MLTKPATGRIIDGADKPFSPPAMKRKLLLVLLLMPAMAGFVCASYYISFSPPERSPENRIPTEALRAVEDAQEVVLYSLQPCPRRKTEIVDGKVLVKILDDGPKFHGYLELGQTALESPVSRKMAVEVLSHAVREWKGDVYLCFNPRHGIRATTANGTYDIVICFECCALELYCPDGTRHTFGIAGTGGQLNRVLRRAQVPIAK